MFPKLLQFPQESGTLQVAKKRSMTARLKIRITSILQSNDVRLENKFAGHVSGSFSDLKPTLFKASLLFEHLTNTRYFWQNSPGQRTLSQ